MLTEKRRSNLSFCSLIKKKKKGSEKALPPFWRVDFYVGWQCLRDNSESVEQQSWHTLIDIHLSTTRIYLTGGGCGMGRIWYGMTAVDEQGLRTLGLAALGVGMSLIGDWHLFSSPERRLSVSLSPLLAFSLLSSVTLYHYYLYPTIFTPRSLGAAQSCFFFPFPLFPY